MKKQTLRGVACALCLLLLTPMLAMLWTLPAAAAQGEGQRFIFSALHTAGEKEYAATAAEPLTLTLSENEYEFVADAVTTVATDSSTNAIYLSLVNTSNATGLRVSYGYMESEPKVFSFEQALIPGSPERQSFVLPNPHITKNAFDLTLTFISNEELTGTVTLESFFDVSVYTGETGQSNTPADCNIELKRCEYDRETGTIHVEGTLSYVAAARYTGLALFSLGPGEEIYLSNKTPVARANVSEKTSFTVSVDSAEEAYARYVVAGITDAGEREPLCAPVYPTVLQEGTPYETGFKGYHTDSIYNAIDGGADVSVVDVYLDKLQGDRNNGILYAGDHSYYYFDESYIREIDRRVQNLSGTGCSVYLRFLISPDANGLPFVTYTEESGGIVNKGIAITGEAALLSVHAFTDFLTLRYTSGSYGRICGIILGRKADRASVYGYVGSMGLADYAELYADALTLIAGTAGSNDPGLRMVVPISDRMWSETVTPDNLNGDYFTELFLLSLLEALKTRNLKSPAFSVMAESESIPDRVALIRQDTYGTDRLSALLGVIEQYAAHYNYLDTDILYAWTPSEEMAENELSVAYALQYVALSLQERVESFIVDFSSAELTGQSNAAKRLHRLISVINTQAAEDALTPVLAHLGIGSFAEIFSTYREGILQDRQTALVALSNSGYGNGRTPVGSYDMWDFSNATGVLNWYAGNACGELSVLGRTLTAPFSPTEAGSFADLAYHFGGARDLSFAPLISLWVGVDGDAATPYEIQMRLIGDDACVTASAVIASGSVQRLYLDLTDSAALLTALRCIRVMARPLNGSDASFTMRLQAITVESVSLTSAELAERMEQEESGEQGTGQGEENRAGTTPLVATALVIGASIAFASILIIRAHHHPKTVAVSDKQTEEDADKKRNKTEASPVGENAPPGQKNRSDNKERKG